jgi:hypothetical protein
VRKIVCPWKQQKLDSQLPTKISHECVGGRSTLSEDPKLWKGGLGALELPLRTSRGVVQEPGTVSFLTMIVLRTLTRLRLNLWFFSCIGLLSGIRAGTAS